MTVSAEERHAGARLRYQRCPVCGRCDGWSLTVDGQVVATGQAARVMYRARVMESTTYEGITDDES
jgi:hypothetical protein